MKIRPITKADADAWLAMRVALWPDANEDALRLEAARYFVAHGEPLLPHCVFVAEDDGKAIGMLELSLRPHVDGCDSSPVPFIEGWYVVPEARRSGVGGALVKAAEAGVGRAPVAPIAKAAPNRPAPRRSPRRDTPCASRSAGETDGSAQAGSCCPGVPERSVMVGGSFASQWFMNDLTGSARSTTRTSPRRPCRIWSIFPAYS